MKYDLVEWLVIGVIIVDIALVWLGIVLSVMS